MIHSLSIKNFLSFKNEVTISFEASKKITDLEEFHVVEVAKGVRLQKLAIVYGYNASGKSNLIQAFKFLKHFWLNILSSKDEYTEVIPFFLDDSSFIKPSVFKIIFYHDGIKHRYILKITPKVIISEKLEYYPSVQPALIFERRFEEGISKIVYGNKIKISAVEKQEIAIKCIPNISVFASYIQVNTTIKEIETALDWIKRGMMPSIESLTQLQRVSEKLTSEDNDFKKYILDYLKEADFNISNLNSEVINEGVAQKHKLFIKEQSGGTKRVFGLSGVIYRAIKKNAFLPIDEIEAKLHPRLVEYVLEKFLRESKHAQLLVATHYDNLFDEEDLFRKDNFWFVEKGKDGATELYRLSDFKGLSRISSLQKAYKFGKFGAVPNID